VGLAAFNPGMAMRLSTPAMARLTERKKKKKKKRILKRMKRLRIRNKQKIKLQ
jgi:hypothetical protein